MEFDIRRLYDDDSFVSPGSIGGKIKRYRELRGWSQQELGIRCGFSDSSADVRIAQYERNKKIPREKALKEITTALRIDECALFDADMLSYNMMFHTLFDIEDFHGLHPVRKDDGFYLEFSGSTISGQYIAKQDYDDFLEKWYEMRQKCTPNDSDSPEERSAKEADYTLWKGSYPDKTARETAEKMYDSMREHRLQAELDRLYAKRERDTELNRINSTLGSIIDEEEASCIPVQYESELIYLILDTMTNGLPLLQFSPDEFNDKNYDYIHLLSVKSNDITKNENNMRLYARLQNAFDRIRHHRINVTQSITSKNKELYVTFQVPYSQHHYFDNLFNSWKDIHYIVERSPFIGKDKLQDLVRQRLGNITGDNDVCFEEWYKDPNATVSEE